MKTILNKLITVLCLLFVSQSAFSQSAVGVLDKVAEKFKSGGDVVIGFTVNSKDASSDGTIKLSGQKFHIALTGMNIWFNGKTMWSYVEENMEVNVTNPTPAEVAKLNPYSFVTLYKSGYKTKFDKSTSVYHDIILTAVNNDKDFKNINVRINKSNMQLMYVKMQTENGSVEIKVNSYKSAKFKPDTFVFNKKKYPGVDIIDLR